MTPSTKMSERRIVEHLRAYETVFESNLGTAARARQWLDSLELDLPGDVKLLTHELVVNAIRHTRTEYVWLVVLASPTVIRVQVSNEGRTDPHLDEPGPFSDSGRGLRWVDALSQDWDSEKTSATHVWFQVPRPDPELVLE